MSDDPLLSVRGLTKHYPITEGVLRREVGRVRAVDGISFDLFPGETLGLVGESGCGKSTAVTSLLRLEEPTAGSVVFDGEAVTDFSADQLQRFRRRTGMIFQDPNSSFDPRMTIGESVVEPLENHGLGDRESRRDLAGYLFERVGLSRDDLDRYPHEFSGGQKQRAALARALVVNPDLLVADEPVSALDVSVQATILSLLSDLQADFGLSILLISHDMGVVREVCDRVAVMYLGEIVEIGPTERLLSDPRHPYTRALVASIPTPGEPGSREAHLTGTVPDPADPPSGCRFHTRCPAVIPPEGFAVADAGWQRVHRFRLAVASGEVGPAALRARAAGDESDAVGTSSDEPSFADDNEDPDAVPAERLRAAVREAYDLPDELGDPDADAVLEDAVAAVADGDFATATERLAAFESVCERRHPDLRAFDDRSVACHLHAADDRERGALRQEPTGGS